MTRSKLRARRRRHLAVKGRGRGRRHVLGHRLRPRQGRDGHRRRVRELHYQGPRGMCRPQPPDRRSRRYRRLPSAGLQGPEGPSRRGPRIASTPTSLDPRRLQRPCRRTPAVAHHGTSAPSPPTRADTPALKFQCFLIACVRSIARPVSAVTVRPQSRLRRWLSGLDLRWDIRAPGRFGQIRVVRISPICRSRLRIALEGSLSVPLSVGGELEPSLELGMRHDGGDAETGFGADIGAGLGWTDPARGLKAEARAPGLLTHEDDGFRERGFSGSVAWQQKPSSDRGATARERQRRYRAGARDRTPAERAVPGRRLGVGAPRPPASRSPGLSLSSSVLTSTPCTNSMGRRCLGHVGREGRGRTGAGVKEQASRVAVTASFRLMSRGIRTSRSGSCLMG